jgi:hypothetical protein
MVFVFTCKSDPTQHKPHHRPCKKTSEGTANLKLGAEKCDEQNGVVAVAMEPDGNGVASALTYSVAAHRTLISLHCAKNQWPFNSILDDDYQMEVQMLRPGTVLPHLATVSHDIHTIYIKMAKRFCDYFKVCFCIVIVSIDVLT